MAEGVVGFTRLDEITLVLAGSMLKCGYTIQGFEFIHISEMQTTMLKHLNKKQTNWIVKVWVARKYVIPTNNDDKVPGSLELLLKDNEGDRIQATVTPPYISKFDAQLREQMICYLTNFSVKDNLGRIIPETECIVNFDNVDLFGFIGHVVAKHDAIPEVEFFIIFIETYRYSLARP